MIRKSFFSSLMAILGLCFYFNVQAQTTPEAVDLGLSVKWASSNLGANSPYDGGNCFTWGNTKPSDPYDSPPKCYLYHKKIKGNISGTQYDAARKALGNYWRMPTEEEATELLKKCKWIYTAEKGGYLVVGPNGNSIFITLGHYWTSSPTPHDYYSVEAMCLLLDGRNTLVSNYLRYRAYLIRPVTK